MLNNVNETVINETAIEQILNLVHSWSDDLLVYAIALTAVGTLSMALLDAFKGLIQYRVRYNERTLKNWINYGLLRKEEELSWLYDDDGKLLKDLFECKLDEGTPKGTLKDTIIDNGAKQFISLATGSREDDVRPVPSPFYLISKVERALYTLPLEKMMGQIQDSVELTLQNPKVYPELFILITNKAADSDIKEWLEYCLMPYSSKSEIGDKEREGYANLNNRIQQTVQRTLDNFQLISSYKWARTNQYCSIALGASLLYIALISIDKSDKYFVPSALWLSILGGFVAPFAKDLVTRLRQVRANG